MTAVGAAAVLESALGGEIEMWFALRYVSCHPLLWRYTDLNSTTIDMAYIQGLDTLSSMFSSFLWWKAFTKRFYGMNLTLPSARPHSRS